MSVESDFDPPAKKPDWGYQDHNGPACWASLDIKFACCGNGVEQSPIDFVDWQVEELPPVRFDYGPASASVENTGHSIEVKPETEHGITLVDKQFRLIQFHFHHRSEHLFGGRQYPMELHLVHATEAGHLAVVGVAIVEGDECDALAPVWTNMPETADGPRELDEMVDLRRLVPDTGVFFRYQGSLTTPPCTEGVRWLIARETIDLSADQIAKFARLFPNNFRPVQPLGDRTVLLG